jgi:hypothetical protein
MINFFKVECQTPNITVEEFGLCDDKQTAPAEVDFVDKNRWIATVFNKKPYTITFTAIDKCVLQDNEYEGRGRCDCMLTTNKHLLLVELKSKAPPWIAGALQQLESTIQFLKENHDLSAYKIRKIHACNKEADEFFVFDNDDNAEFLKRTTFRRDVQTNIVIF